MKKRNKKPARVITKGDVLDIREYLMESKNEYKRTRDVMLFNIAIATGYRMQDLVDLKIRDLRHFLDEGYFIITEKKKVNALKAKLVGKKDKFDKDDALVSKEEILNKKVEPRKVEILSGLRPLIEEYIKGKKGRAYAFMSIKCKKEDLEEGKASHITRESFSKIIKKAGQEACKKENISGHSLRKCFARTIYDGNDKDLETVRKALGHTSIEVTKRYLGLDEEQEHEALQVVNTLFR